MKIWIAADEEVIKIVSRELARPFKLKASVGIKTVESTQRIVEMGFDMHG